MKKGTACKWIGLLSLSLTFATAFAFAARGGGPESRDISLWLARRVPTAERFLSENISPALPGFKRGFVVAAPWTVPGVQNYEYHWVRDAALVMSTVVTRYIATTDPWERKAHFREMRDYSQFSWENQTAPEPDDAEKVGLGEVKFNPDGSRYTHWMRPQNDGPALRAITLIRFARALARQGELPLVRHLYDGSVEGREGFDAPGVIGADLGYLADHWRDASYDPWEEVKGHHFYTRLVQRKALLDGAALAESLGISADAERYRDVARQLEVAIQSHWIPPGRITPSGTVSPGQIWASFDRAQGVDYKASGLDVAVVLAALHAHNELDPEGDRFFSPSDDRVLRTSLLLSRAFERTFPVARSASWTSGLGIPIGRYPEDRYDGYDSSHEGNPWYLTTAAFAELYYRCAEEWQASGKISVNAINSEFLSTLTDFPLREGEVLSAGDVRFQAMIDAVRALGDTYLRRVKFQEPKNGHLTEEFSRDDGSPQGAEDLSWSYASILTAAQHRAP